MRGLAFAGPLFFAGLASASTSYTSSALFEAATTVNFTEDYGSGFTNGEDIASGFSADGITYSGLVLYNGATELDVTNQYNDVSGLSLGADHTAVYGSTNTYFLDTEGVTLTFAAPLYAFGMFFNVDLDSGTFGFTTSAGSASTGSTTDDTSTFVFAGIVSSTPFTSVTISSTGALASYTVPELFATTAPEPATFELGLAGGLLFAALKFVRAVRS